MSTTAQNRTHADVSPDAESDLPEGWATATLADCVEILDHLRVPVNSKERDGRQGSIPYYGATGQVGWIDDYIFDEELLLLGEDGAPFLDKTKPVAYVVSGRSWVNNHAHVLRALVKFTSNGFLKHLLDFADFSDFVTGTTRLKLTQSDMRRIPILLPPLPE
jgi:type I restriction enzyme, S subunit